VSLNGWQFYKCNVNDELAFVYLDLSLNEFKSKGEYPVVSWYWIKLNMPRDDGLSSEEEFDALVAHEDRVLEMLDSDRAIYAGRITTRGIRQFYFYTRRGFDFAMKLKDFIGGKPEFQFQLGEKADVDWKHYQNTLYPGENGIRQILERAEQEKQQIAQHGPRKRGRLA